MLTWLTGRIAAYVAGGLLLAAIAASGFAWYEHGRAADLERERDGAIAQRDDVARAAIAKDGTIAEQQKAIREWQALVPSADTVKDAARRAEEAAKAIENRARDLNAREEADRARPDCAALLAMDVAAACPPIARGLRERAARGDARGPDPGAGARRPADP